MTNHLYVGLPGAPGSAGDRVSTEKNVFNTKICIV